LISKRGVKQFKLLDKEIHKKIKKSFKCLSINPFEKRSGCDIKKLNSSTKHDFYRLKFGDYRIIYTVVEKKVKITEILHRSRAYKFLI